jgi:uncharacterized protein (TIGR00369 family)
MHFTSDLIAAMNQNSLYTTIGITIDSANQGQASSRLEPNPSLCWPFPGQPHGGILFTLMDSTMAWAVISQLESGYNCSTIHLDIQYTAPAKGACFTCSARVVYRAGRTSFVRADINDEKGLLVATGQSTFRVFKHDTGIAGDG